LQEQKIGAKLHIQQISDELRLFFFFSLSKFRSFHTTFWSSKREKGILRKKEKGENFEKERKRKVST
jgi:hypothetical protein